MNYQKTEYYQDIETQCEIIDNMQHALMDAGGLWSKDSELYEWFNQLGLWHADDISSIILDSLECDLQGKELNIQAEIDKFTAHWKKYGETNDG